MEEGTGEGGQHGWETWGTEMIMSRRICWNVQILLSLVFSGVDPGKHIDVGFMIPPSPEHQIKPAH